MSGMYFHGPDRTAEVSGAERAHFRNTCSKMAWGIIEHMTEEWSGHRSLLRRIIPPDSYVLEASDFKFSARMFFDSFDDYHINLEGKQIKTFTLNLNTAYFMGSDPIRLAARLHGQCELHAYVEGANRKWLADIIRQGRKFKFYRDCMGWEAVIELLEQDDETPIVTSFSVCDWFPNRRTANFQYPALDEDEDERSEIAWDNLLADEQWQMGLEGLRRQFDQLLELNPETWADYYFADGIDANMLVAALHNSSET